MRLVAARAGAVVATTAVTGVGVWVTGGVLTDDASVARVLTGAWFVVVGGLAVAAALRWRAVAVAVVGAWLVTSVAVGGFLLLTSSVDRTDRRGRRPRSAVHVAAGHRAGDGRAGQGGSGDPGGRRPLPVRCARHPRSGLPRPTALGRPGSDADPFHDQPRPRPAGPPVAAGWRHRRRRGPGPAQGQQGRPAVRRPEAGPRRDRGHLVPGLQRRVRFGAAAPAHVGLVDQAGSREHDHATGPYRRGAAGGDRMDVLAELRASISRICDIPVDSIHAESRPRGAGRSTRSPRPRS